jgi:CBS domain-containing protein
MRINHVYLKKVVTARPADPVNSVARQMHEHNVGTVVVLDAEGRPIGIVTDRDLALALGARDVARQCPVEKVMTRRVVAVPEDADLLAATKFFRECGVRRLPVVDRDDRVVGLVSLDDLLQLLVGELNDLVQAIRSEMVVK